MRTFTLSAVEMARIITEARADAWEQGHRAGAMWEYTGHVEGAENPYLAEDGAE